MRIFINHVNTYSGVALASSLRRIDGVLNRLFGTAKGLEDGAGPLGAPGAPGAPGSVEQLPPVPAVVRRVVSKRNPQQLLQNLLSCSLAVFDLHNTSPEEVEFVLKKLKTAQLDHPLTVVLISSVLTWGNTRREYVEEPPLPHPSDSADADQPEGPQASDPSSPREKKEAVGDNDVSSPRVSAGEESPRGSGETAAGPGAGGAAVLKPRVFSGSNFELRVPPRAYERWKMVETLLISLNSKENLRGFVVCAGLMYGCGEDALYEHFKAAWLGLQTHKLVSPGSNFVPTVHVQDVCSLVRELALDGSPNLGSYHLAVDGAHATQRELLQAIVSEVGRPFELPVASAEEAALVESTPLLALNLRFECSTVMTSRDFPWHAREGFVRAIKRVANEFCHWRKLRHLKIFVTGPPGCGKSAVSARLAEHFNICHVKTAEVVARARLGDAEGSGGAAAAAGGSSSSSSPTAAAAAAESAAAKGRKRTTARRVRHDAETMARLFRATLSDNVCRYRGFVLDGYPKSYEECAQLCLRPKQQQQPAAAASETDTAGEETADTPTEESTEREVELELDPLLAPDFIVALRAPPEVCEKHMLALPPAAVMAGHNDREGFKRRMQLYMQLNESVEGHPKVTDFFQERGTEVLTLPVEGRSLHDLFVAISIYVTRFGPINNFLLDRGDWLKEQEEQLEQQEALEEEQQQQREQQERQQEQQLLQRRRERDMARLRRIAEHEQQLLLIRSLPLRRYLMQHVIPTLSEGLLEVCKVAPEDPVSYLAEFLFSKARQMD